MVCVQDQAIEHLERIYLDYYGICSGMYSSYDTDSVIKSVHTNQCYDVCIAY